jgi:hypothetical protein
VVVRFGFRFLPIAALLIAAMNVPYVQAQGRHHGSSARGMAHGVAPLLVLGHDAVQKELALTPEQTDKVKQLVAEVHEEWSQQIHAAGAGSHGDRNQASEDQQKRHSEMRSNMANIAKSVNDKFRGKLAEILNRPQQTRLREIAIQAASTQAFQDAEVARDLNLTKAQQDQLAAVHQEFADKFSQLRTEGGDRQSHDRYTKMRELRQDELSRSISVLTQSQQGTFAKMTGKPFDLAQLHQSHARHGGHTRGAKSA